MGVITLLVDTPGGYVQRRPELPGVPREGETLLMPTGRFVAEVDGDKAREVRHFTVERVVWSLVDCYSADVYLVPSVPEMPGLEDVLRHNGFTPV